MFQEKENYRQLCDQLYQNGIIKQDDSGAIVAVESIEEQEQIRSKTKQKKVQENIEQHDLHSQLEDLGPIEDINDRDKMDGLE